MTYYDLILFELKEYFGKSDDLFLLNIYPIAGVIVCKLLCRIPLNFCGEG